MDSFSSDDISAEHSEEIYVPDNVFGPFMPVTQHDINFFNDVIAQEVDSAYTSSICCCDACYDDFQRYWPGVAYREMEFQTQSMSLFWFIEYSRIVDCYTPTELSTLRHFVECPRCHENIAGNMWLYEHRFSDAEELEDAIEELSAIGRRTPFLILEHELARQLLEAIRQHASTVSPAPLPQFLYRARAAASMIELGQLPSEIQSYGAAPPEYVTEGRFNHAGSPMIYLANTANTALREIGEPDKDFNVASLAINQPLKVFDLVDIDEEISSYELFGAVANSALLAAPRTGKGWLRQQYVFSRFVADCAKSAGFDAIRYGSTKDPSGWNYVLLEPSESVARLVSWEVLRSNFR